MLFVVIGYVSYAMCSTSYIDGLCTLYSVRYYRGEMYGVKGRGGEPRTYLLYGVSSVWGRGTEGGGEVRGGVRGSFRQLCYMGN